MCKKSERFACAVQTLNLRMCQAEAVEYHTSSCHPDNEHINSYNIKIY